MYDVEIIKRPLRQPGQGLIFCFQVYVVITIEEWILTVRYTQGLITDKNAIYHRAVFYYGRSLIPKAEATEVIKKLATMLENLPPS